jgi:hypothetical protein
MKEAPGSSETSVLTRATRRNNPEDTIPQGQECLHFHIIQPDCEANPTSCPKLTEGLSLKVIQQEREADHSQTTAEVKKWSIWTSTPTYVVTTRHLFG